MCYQEAFETPPRLSQRVKTVLPFLDTEQALNEDTPLFGRGLKTLAKLVLVGKEDVLKQLDVDAEKGDQLLSHRPDTRGDRLAVLRQQHVPAGQLTLEAVIRSVQVERQFDAAAIGSLVDQMVGFDRSSRDLLGKDVDAEESEPDRVDNAALPLPVMTKDIVLACRELSSARMNERKPVSANFLMIREDLLANIGEALLAVGIGQVAPRLLEALRP